MNDVQPNRTIPIFIAVSILFLCASGCSGPPTATEEPVKPVTVGRYQIVSEPSGIILKIDTHDGATTRLVRNPENGSYLWEIVTD